LLKIGITQRVTIQESYLEIRDSLDHEWYKFAAACDMQFIPLPNIGAGIVEYVENLALDGIVLSGGNNISHSSIEHSSAADLLIQFDYSEVRNQTENQLIEWAREKNKKMLGVCRGFQMLGVAEGLEICEVDAQKHVAQVHNISVLQNQDWIHREIKEVNSYHRYGISLNKVGNQVEVLASTDDVLEAFISKDENFLGIMWHPERNQPADSNDILLFKRFFVA
jgi:N5-(cytidine 5'-diphosphoramidyl)-L-glutamine hydrolase